jgi:hypothetical protein
MRADATMSFKSMLRRMELVRPRSPGAILACAVTVTLIALPQAAHASCSGTACSSFAVEGRSYSASDTMAKATLVNRDSSKKIHLKGCVTVKGQCGSANSFDVTIEPSNRMPISKPISAMLAKPNEAQNFVVDVTTAEFLPLPAAAQPPSSSGQAGLCPGPGRPVTEEAKQWTCCCDVARDYGTRVSHLLTCTHPSACQGKCVTNVKQCYVSYDETVAPKPAPASVKPPDIKVNVVNGESQPLLVTLWDVDTNAVIADRTLWNDAPYPVTLHNKDGKGHLKWAVATLRQGQSTSMLKFIPWDGSSTYHTGDYVVLGGSYYRATKDSQHVTPPNDAYWQPMSDPTKASPGAKPSMCGEGNATYSNGDKVVLKASHSC